MDLIRRDAWGAAPPKGRPLAISAPVRDLFLHHSATPDNGPATVRAIQKFHQDTRGWADVGYSWLYSPRDRVFFEGRGPGISGAHTRNHNRTSHAVCVLGNFQASVPAPHVMQDLADWARWHGTTWGPGVYRTHDEVGATACPGQYLKALVPQINEIATADPVLDPDPEPADETTFRATDYFDIYDGWHARLVMERKVGDDDA
jgi:N-acetylmuramoyl-L-alanine amidase